MEPERRQLSILFVRIFLFVNSTCDTNILKGGDVLPDAGQVIISGTSVITNPRTARAHLGVCPQFIPIDCELTVREHLVIYGRLKGLRPGPELNVSVDTILHGTSLAGYADRLASKLSGGNQKKLSLAIALMGNPTVLLIDEFSTGVDPKMKRDMWHTLRGVAKGKAVVVTTREFLAKLIDLILISVNHRFDGGGSCFGKWCWNIGQTDVR